MANVGKPRHETFTGNTRRRPEQYSLKLQVGAGLRQLGHRSSKAHKSNTGEMQRQIGLVDPFGGGGGARAGGFTITGNLDN